MNLKLSGETIHIKFHLSHNEKEPDQTAIKEKKRPRERKKKKTT